MQKCSKLIPSIIDLLRGAVKLERMVKQVQTKTEMEAVVNYYKILKRGLTSRGMPDEGIYLYGLIRMKQVDLGIYVSLCRKGV